MGEGTGCILLGKYKLTNKGKKELEKERKCKECGGYFQVDEIVFCDGYDHYHRDCIKQKK